jgi:hypothetical protein
LAGKKEHCQGLKDTGNKTSINGSIPVTLCGFAQNEVDPKDSQRAHSTYKGNEPNDARNMRSAGRISTVVFVTEGVSLKDRAEGSVFPHAIVEIKLFRVTDLHVCREEVTGTLNIETCEKAKGETKETFEYRAIEKVSQCTKTHGMLAFQNGFAVPKINNCTTLTRFPA